MNFCTSLLFEFILAACWNCTGNLVLWWWCMVQRRCKLHVIDVLKKIVSFQALMYEMGKGLVKTQELSLSAFT